jgi:hypothetical protein
MNLEFERVENGVPSGDTVLNPFRIAISGKKMKLF